MLFDVKVLGKHPEHSRSFTLLRRKAQPLQNILKDIALSVNERGQLLTKIKISLVRTEKPEPLKPTLPFED